jgi:glycosyltransferase involved in cell wall biosynthesis
MPVLSVIIANYNSEKYLQVCVESILEQTYKDYEIVILDDFSTDDSPGTIRQYETRYPGVLRGIFSSRNQGAAAARHEAILAANGEYFTTLDSDDYYYDSNKLQKEMELVLQHKQETGRDILAFSNIVMISGDKVLIRIVGNPGNIKEGRIFNLIISRSCMIPRDFIMKKETYFEVGGYDLQFPIYEDWDLKIRLAHRYEFYYTGIIGTAYRRHGKGLSSSPMSDHINWLTHIFNKNLHLANPIDRESIRHEFQKYIEVRKNRL